MMSVNRESADELLDELVARLKSAPVPEYPGPPNLDFSSHPAGSLPSRAPRASKRSGAFAVACSVLALSAVVILQPETRMPAPHDLKSVVTQTAHVRPRDPDRELQTLERELDQVSQRLDRLEQEIACQELRAGAESVLAHYSNRPSKLW